MSGIVPAFRMPAEWEAHRATWIGWPHHEPDWPGKLPAVQWAYAEIARVLADFEAVEILCQTDEACAEARAAALAHRARMDRDPPARGAHRSHVAA